MSDKPGMIGQALYGKRIETLEAENGKLQKNLEEAQAAIRDLMDINDDGVPEKYWAPEYRKIIERCKAVVNKKGGE